MRSIVVLSLIVLATLAATAFFALRPATFLGVREKALADSLASETGSSGSATNCSKRDGDIWRCRVSDGAEATYRVEMEERGCWNARHTSDAALSERAEGCIHILNYVFD